jgi:hypothetical protein
MKITKIPKSSDPTAPATSLRTPRTVCPAPIALARIAVPRIISQLHDVRQRHKAQREYPFFIAGY